MKTDFDYIDENIKKIMFNVQEAKAKYRSPDDEIKIMAVTKTVAPEAVNRAVSAGITLLGENRVQEYLGKKDFYNPKAEVHFIGHLQTNKVKYIIKDIPLIHSVSSFKLAEEINRCAAKINKVQDVLAEVNIGREESKSGIMPEDTEEVLRKMSELKNIRVKGLMTIPPDTQSEEFLYKMHSLYIDISEKNIDNISMDILSMGMSGDYVAAVKYGSNILRIGSAMFGARIYS